MPLESLINAIKEQGASIIILTFAIQILLLVMQTIYVHQKSEMVRTEATANLEKTVSGLVLQAERDKKDLMQRIDALMAENSNFQEKMSELKSTNQGLAKQVDELIAQRKTIDSELSAARRQINDLNVNMRELERKRLEALAELEKEVETVQKQANEIANLRLRVHELEMEVSRLRGANESLISVFDKLGINHIEIRKEGDNDRVSI